MCCMLRPTRILVSIECLVDPGAEDASPRSCGLITDVAALSLSPADPGGPADEQDAAAAGPVSRRPSQHARLQPRRPAAALVFSAPIQCGASSHSLSALAPRDCDTLATPPESTCAPANTTRGSPEAAAPSVLQSPSPASLFLTLLPRPLPPQSVTVKPIKAEAPGPTVGPGTASPRVGGAPKDAIRPEPQRAGANSAAALAWLPTAPPPINTRLPPSNNAAAAAAAGRLTIQQQIALLFAKDQAWQQQMAQQQAVRRSRLAPLSFSDFAKRASLPLATARSTKASPLTSNLLRAAFRRVGRRSRRSAHRAPQGAAQAGLCPGTARPTRRPAAAAAAAGRRTASQSTSCTSWTRF